MRNEIKYEIKCPTCDMVGLFTINKKGVQVIANRFGFRQEKEVAKEIMGMIDCIPTTEVNELNHLRLLKQEIRKKYGIKNG